MKQVRIELEKFINAKGKIGFFGEKKPQYAPNTKTVLDIIKVMEKKDKRIIIITDQEQFRIRGIVTCSDICNFLGGGEKSALITDWSDCYHQIYERPISSIMTTAVRKIKEDVPLFIGVYVMIEQKIGTLPLIDNYGDLIGIITERHIAFLLADKNVEVKVRALMTPKVITCTPDCTIIETLKIVCDRGFRRLPIVDGENLVGYLTVKDLIRYFAQKNVIRKIKENNIEAIYSEKISTIMSTPVITVPPDTSVTQFAQILKKHNIGAAPVVEDDKLVGIITERDILQAMAFPQA